MGMEGKKELLNFISSTTDFSNTIYLHLMLPTIKESVAAFKPH